MQLEEKHLPDRRPPGAYHGLTIQAAEDSVRADGKLDIIIHCAGGDVLGVLHPSDGAREAVLWVSGSFGGFTGPAGLYPDLADSLTLLRMVSLRLHYRHPNAFDDCVADVLTGIAFLHGRGIEGVVLVGHSFGGAVVIAAGTSTSLVKGVVALASQTHGATAVAHLKPPLLLVHGMADRRLPPLCSQTIYQWAPEPKPDLVLLPGATHSLRQCYEQVKELLRDWIRKRLKTAG